MVKKLGVLLLICAFIAIPNANADVGKIADPETKAEIQALQTMFSDLQGVLDQQKAALGNSDKTIAALRAELADVKSQSARAAQAVASAPAVPSSASIENQYALKMGGDFRFRWQSDSNNSTQDRNRMRLRLRYGITKQVNDELLIGFRFATGDQTGQQYYNTLGNTATGSSNGMEKMDVWLDQAYLKYTPEMVEGLTIFAGKFAPNWKNKGLLIHPEGCGFDGVGESYVYDITDSISGDINLAQLIMSEGSGVDSDSELYVFDTGVMGTLDNGQTWGVRGTAYMFDGFSEANQTAAGNVGLGNTTTIGNPFVAVTTLDYGFSIQEMPVNLFTQIGKNFNDATGDPANEDMFYSVGASLKTLKDPGDWTVCYKFAHIELNAMPQTLIDADHVGGVESHTVEFTYRLTSATDLNYTLIVPKTIDGDGENDTFINKFNVTTKF